MLTTECAVGKDLYLDLTVTIFSYLLGEDLGANALRMIDGVNDRHFEDAGMNVGG
ncbi:hypothetical protein GBS0709_10760 [Edwardsiella tarda]|nr:hypothetical protein GBS0709_10760 [Edwardsiella tarda]